MGVNLTATYTCDKCGTETQAVNSTAYSPQVLPDGWRQVMLYPEPGSVEPPSFVYFGPNCAAETRKWGKKDEKKPEKAKE